MTDFFFFKIKPMKFIQTHLFLTMLFLASMNTSFSQLTKGAQIEFKEQTHNYGTVKYGSDGSYVFTFTNTGNAPLTISKCESSCGCTIPSWPKEPIAPGAKGEIKVVYDTKKSGAINKEVYIFSNAVNESKVSLRIKGNVMPKPSN